MPLLSREAADVNVIIIESRLVFHVLPRPAARWPPEKEAWRLGALLGRFDKSELYTFLPHLLVNEGMCREIVIVF